VVYDVLLSVMMDLLLSDDVNGGHLSGVLALGSMK
jgi:hypothetical protein